MGSKPKDITGQRFGRLIALENTGEKQGTLYLWKCKCDCGNEAIANIGDLKIGKVKSCGCALKESGFKNMKNLIDQKNKEKTNLLNINNKPNKNNKSGYKGVFFSRDRCMWVAHMNFQGVTVLREYFTNKQDAIDARKEAEEKYFKPMLEKYGKELKESGDKNE